MSGRRVLASDGGALLKLEDGAALALLLELILFVVAKGAVARFGGGLVLTNEKSRCVSAAKDNESDHSQTLVDGTSDVLRHVGCQREQMREHVGVAPHDSAPRPREVAQRVDDRECALLAVDEPSKVVA